MNITDYHFDAVIEMFHHVFVELGEYVRLFSLNGKDPRHESPERRSGDLRRSFLLVPSHSWTV